MSEVPKDLEDVSAGIGQFLKNLIYKNFVLNLMSKLARSTLTLPGRSRVRYLNMYMFKNCFDDKTYYLCRTLLKLDKESF
jgi:hypothetical protein